VGFAVTGVYPSPDLPVGNPKVLNHMIDYTGKFCGIAGGHPAKPYAYFLPSQEIVCVAECPSALDLEK
jgi:hypothetical protein